MRAIVSGSRWGSRSSAHRTSRWSSISKAPCGIRAWFVRLGRSTFSSRGTPWSTTRRCWQRTTISTTSLGSPTCSTSTSRLHREVAGAAPWCLRRPQRSPAGIRIRRLVGCRPRSRCRSSFAIESIGERKNRVRPRSDREVAGWLGAAQAHGGNRASVPQRRPRLSR